MNCNDCGEPILRGETTATGPDGVIHHRCFKRGTAHGKEITLLALHDEINRLKQRVQELERTVEDHHHIDFRVGGQP